MPHDPVPGPTPDDPLILVIDDDEDVIRHLVHVLHANHYRTTYAADGAVGLAIAEKYRPNVILLDLDMPGMDGLAVCGELKARLATADIPVVIITGAERTDELVTRCFDAGAHDFLSKPVRSVNLLARLRVVLRDQSLIDSYRRMAILDPLTGLANRRQFILYLADAVLAARRSSAPSALLLADIDQLAAINEAHGYDLGDEVILTLSRIINRLTTHTCKAGRIGGEEFGLVLQDVPADRALAIARRLCNTFSAIAFDASTQPKHFYATFGVACFDGTDPAFTADTFLRQADAALCIAKQHPGHGRVAAWWELDPAALEAIQRENLHSRARTRQPSQRAYVGLPAGETSPPAPAEPPADTPR
jgi:diguanylate cyclase (GGDEF)-like protein